MEVLKAHPHTQAMLDAWQRLTDGENASDGPATDEYPGLVNNLFLLTHVAERDFAFRRVGATLDRLFGRQLDEHDFLSIWNDVDRRLVAAGLSMAVKNRGPTVIHARGETLAGKRLDLEFALAPLLHDDSGPRRFLGLCQAITPEEALGGRPLRRLQVCAIFPPAPVMRPALRLVASS
ncbi:MAG: PAS domain-containing protein [Hyphomonadaceae bacterium]